MYVKGKKIFGIFLMIAFSVNQLHAQTWSEWFSQKKTQKKYLIEQLAALKLYAGYLKKGYEIGSSGLKFIKDASRGEFDLHDAFFSSLKRVSPVIRKNVRIAEILEMQLEISKACAGFRKVQNLSSANHLYIDLVCSNLLDNCLNDLEQLLQVVTSGRLELSDDERIVRIDGLHLRMQQKKIFVDRFSGDIRSLDRERRLEIKNIKEMEVRYGH